MTNPTRSILPAIIIALLCIVCTFTSADIVTLKDGTVYEGIVIKESRAEVIIEITIANIKSTKTFPRYKVKSIEHKPVESITKEKKTNERTSRNTDTDSPSTKADRPKRTRKRINKADRVLYMVIPVVGTIGEETNAVGLRKALTTAIKRQINHIVFRIDSPGGYIYDAVETLEVLKEFDEQLHYHALVIGGAISAASVYVAGADDIFVHSDARVGGAVAYTKENTSGAAEVDAKFNSIWAAGLAARAESKGYPGEIFRAMVVQNAQVWINDDGSASSLRKNAKSEQIDTPTTILTIRASQMIQVHMATEFSGRASGLGALLEIENWSEAKGVGEKIMRIAARDRVRASKKIKAALIVYYESLVLMEKYDPRNYTDYYWEIFTDKNDGVFNRIQQAPSRDSLRLWKIRNDRAIYHANMLIAAIEELARYSIIAEKAGALHLGIPSEINERKYEDVIEERDWFFANRTIPRSLIGRGP